MRRFWNEKTRNLKPYVPGEQPRDRKFIKLNTNENPYPPSPAVIRAAKEAVERARLYPDPDCLILREAAAEYYNVSIDNIFAGNGSDEVLALAFMTFFDSHKPILFPDITYTFYPVYCNLLNIPYITAALREDFSVPVDKFMGFNGGGIVLANPNAPTGILLGLKEIEAIVGSNPDSVVILDEAYIDFGGETAVPLVKKYENLLIVQTLSKSRSLAGLRVSVAIGGLQLIEGLVKVKNSFNSYTLDHAALAAGAQAFRDVSYFNEIRDKIIQTRERTAGNLREMGFTVTDSKANFLFVSHRDINAEFIFHYLRNNGILVRYFNLPRINNYLRITVGTDNEMDTLIDVLNEMLSSADNKGMTPK